MSNKIEMSRRTVLAGGAMLGAGAATAGLGATGTTPAPLQTLVAGSEPIPVAVLMDAGATMIDFAGPWEVFQDAGVAGVPGFALFTVAPTLTELQTTGTGKMVDGRYEASGLKFRADYTYADAPQPRVIFMGAQSGGVRGAAPEKLDWIRRAARKADIVMSVCTGAFILADTGLIDGLSATTHHQYLDQFATKFPNVRLQRGKRFVDNGKFISAGGLTSGIDAALHVLQRYYGPAAAQQVADYMEYGSEGWKT